MMLAFLGGLIIGAVVGFIVSVIVCANARK